MFRGSMLFGVCILGLAFFVGTSESQDKKDKKGYLPAGFKALSLTPTQDEKLRQINGDYKTKIDEANKKVKDLRDEQKRMEFAVLTAEQKELYFKNKTGEEAKKKTDDKKSDDKKSDSKKTDDKK